MKRKPTSKKKTATKRTPKKGVRGPAPDLSWHPRFLDILSSTCNVTLAARGAGVAKVTAYEHYKTQPDFARAWDEAKDSAVEILEAEAWQRARKTSDTLLIFLLKAHKPAMYREKFEHKHSGGIGLTFADLATLATDEQQEASDHDSGS